MTFKEKIDKILEVNNLEITSVSGLEDTVGAGRGAINDFYNENREPGRITLKRIMSLPRLNPKWWETGEGDPFIDSPVGTKTTVDPDVPEHVYRNLVEANSDYRLVPKTILNEEYRIMLKSEIDDRQRIFDELIKAKNDLINELKEDLNRLRSQVPSKSA